MKNNDDSNEKRRKKIIFLEGLLPRSGGSVFRLARVAMVRASEIHSGSRPLVDHFPKDKETSIALCEIMEGEVLCGNNGKKISEAIIEKEGGPQ